MRIRPTARLIGSLLVVIAAVAAVIAQPAAAAPPGRAGVVRPGVHHQGSDVYPYLVYTPASVDRRKPAPLVVVVHGCQTTAAQQIESTRYNRIADREGFVLLYPDVDQLDRSAPWPATNCWQFFDPASWHRDGGQAAAIADMTREAMRSSNIDARRVYLIGMSSGGFMASVMSAAYPDLYTAIGIASAGQYIDPSCIFHNPVTRPVTDSARDAYVEMGSRARVVPRFVIGGDSDGTVSSECQGKALQQGMETDNLVRRHQGEKPASLAPTSVREYVVPQGRSATVLTYATPDGRMVDQRWIVHGMDHYWSGGSPDPQLSRWTDARGPDAAEFSWEFFQQFSK
ncbi:extracellular catalytic domain type 1 short-chain-length polyhydroxyalkanoate depolymerase [Jongsikchunia kroppenstedtii]|uniref:extracellular catalytic domain type 1 short-chain-length polyhydroxyalkanoate depolymerase n=1 Tax=Jongsikchunia kroppenstedtii TaxID=1121721 RepID=UPI0003607EEA|nr:PHB depolymerase family esterase [Jongsikchunia kroppenstedtii]